MIPIRKDNPINDEVQSLLDTGEYEKIAELFVSWAKKGYIHVETVFMLLNELEKRSNRNIVTGNKTIN